MRLDPRVAVFTLTKNRIEYTRRMFDSLRKHTDSTFNHFVIDNGSNDGTQEFLETEIEPSRLIFNRENKGLSIGWNQALDLIGDKYDYVVKIDNDCLILTDNWLRHSLDICRAYSDGIVVSPYVEGLLQHKGGVPRYAYETINGYLVGLTEHLGGIALVAPRSAYSGFRFDENLPLRGNQDGTFSAHLKNQGFRLGYIEDIKVEHMDTTAGQHEHYPEYFQQAEKERWTIYGKRSLLMKPRLKLRNKLSQSFKSKKT